MTEERLPVAELLAKAGDADFLRSVAEAVVQLLMETDVEGLIGAARHERSGERTTYVLAACGDNGFAVRSKRGMSIIGLRSAAVPEHACAGRA